MRRVLSVTAAVVIAAAAVAAALVAPGLTQSSTAQPRGTASAGATSSTTAGDARQSVRTAVVGDSLSAGKSRFLGNGLDENSWMEYAQGHGVRYVGGWAKAGAIPQEMAANVRPVQDVDVLVVMAGTNTVGWSRTMPTDVDAFRSIVRTVHPRHVIIAAIPPFGPNPQGSVAYNAQLEQFALAQGWTFTDPWGFARSGADGSAWKPGISADGVHPAGPAGYRELGDALHGSIVSVGGHD